jgi:NADH dehydrogenase [ubiquinone] 1 alpha subcomplex assembly factor 1
MSNSPAFREIATITVDNWMVVNDNVMGGRSAGELQILDGTLVFRGSLNTNGGGFASIRSRGLSASLADFQGIALRVRGDGRTYSCDLRATSRMGAREATWKAAFATVPDRWIDVQLPFAAFVPTWRGRQLDPETDGGTGSFFIRSGSIGVTIADGKDGPFAVTLAAIGVY